MSSLLSTSDLKLSFNTIASIAFFLFLLRLFRQWKKSKAQKQPPGPWKLPLIGSIHHLVGKSHLDILRNLSKKYGPLMHLQVGQVPTIIVSSPKMAKDIMQIHDPAFADKAATLATDIMWYNKKDIAFSPYGDYWTQMRKISMMELLSAKRVRSFGVVRQEEVSRLVESIQSSCGEPINLTKSIFSTVSSMTCRATFGSVREDQESIIKVFRQALAAAGGFDVADLFPSFKILQVITGRKLKLLKMHQQVDKALEDIIENKKKLASTKRGNSESGDEDLVDVLLRLKESGSLQIPIENDHIKAIIFDMFAGGTDTSSITIEMVMSELMRNPRAMAKVQAEIRQVYKKKGSNIDDSDLQGLGYFKSVIKETLRLHPPGALTPRLCREDSEINGYFIPAGTRIMVNLWAIGRDPDHWHNPDSFIPERFEQSSINFTGTHFEFIPFGAGRRVCPGMSFGLASVELPLAHLLLHFNWKLPGGMQPNELDMTRSVGLTSGRKHNLYVIATPYDPSLDN